MAVVVRYILLLLLVLSGSAAAQGTQPPAVAEPAGRLRFDTSEGTWMALDVSPDGRTIAFDLLGDIYTLPVTGGPARPLMTGAAFETQPVFSPDGRRIAFVSDRSGAPNLWVCNLDGSGAVRLSADTGPVIYSSPAWSADGRFVYLSRLTHAALAFELYAYDAAGGTGTRITDARASEKHDDRVNTLGAVASPDGRYLYYARKTGALWSTKALPQWEVVRRDLRDGVEDRLIVSPGAAMRPALSHDGTRLVYASRLGAETGLRVRDLRSGADRWLTFPIDPDTQMGGYYNDLSPRIAFLPGDRELLTEIGGRITRVTLADGRRTPVPFTASVDIGVAPNTRVAVPDETGPVQVRIVQSPRWSPDGRRVVFAALGRLYVQMLGPGTTPQAVSGTTGMAFQPAWTPDGRGLVYVTWSATDGGAVWSIPAAGGTPKRLTADGAFYAEPAVSPDGRTLAVLRANQRERLDLASDLSPMLPTDVVAMPVGGGAAHVVVSRSGARALSFDRAGARLRFLAGNDLVSVASAGGETRREAVIGVPNGNRYFADVQVPPEDVRVSPDGGRMLIKAASQLYLANLPPASGGEPQRLDLNRLPVASAKLTALGADYADWSGDGAGILWSLGSTLRTVSAAGLLGSAPGAAEVKAARIEARVEVPRDVPDGSVVLRGGTAITMRGDEVIRGADVVVTGNRIAAVGRTGGVPVPAGAAIRDVSGRFIIPGFVDTHAHWFEIRRQLLDCGHWDFLANLAYGVTSALEVQPFTIDVFGYQDMIDAGMMIGPRAFSTGPGIFSNTPVDTVDDARNVLTRYRDYYRTRNIKSYMIGNRSERQRMVRATRELGMMATTEGASDFNLDLTHALDGFAGNEHNLPISPLRADVVALYAGARISYTPTLDILYGGKPPLDDMVIGGGMADDAKLRRFIPSSILESRLRGREWTPPADRFWTTFGADALRIRRAGGLVGIGSHGTVQGIGYHLEMALLAQSGATPFEVLRAATLDGAEIIGRKALIGSLEPGKYADLLILSADPLADLHNARAIEGVMKNGRLYDAATLAEVYPRPRPLPRQWFQEDAPSRADARPASAAAVRQAR